eukprot:1393434-Pyramimonas_sp.AAC.1
MTTEGPAEYAVAVTTAAMRMWGLDRVLLGADGEPAVEALVRAVQLARDDETVPRSGPRRDPKNKGAIENANKMVEGMLHTLRASGESRYSTKLTLNHWTMGWMIRLSGWILSRCPVKEDGPASTSN